MTDLIVVEGLVKRFGETMALAGVDLTVAEGTVLGLLGPNGAGKTTVVRILSTLLRADSGRAQVAGLDVVKDADGVRAIIGLTGQYAAVDEYLTGEENLEMVGRLYHLGRNESRRRGTELLERFGLSDAARRPAKTYSGGMRRRLDIAASLIARPRVLFLDEPTTGLDPRSRQGMWDFIENLVSDGTTILLTTQYLEEADRLAGQMVVIDHGKVIARGTGDELKAQVGGQRIVFTVTHVADLPALAELMRPLAVEEPVVDESTRTVSLPVSKGPDDLTEALHRWEGSGIELSDVGLRRPDLDDVFLTLTGHGAEDLSIGEADGADGKAGSRRQQRARAKTKAAAAAGDKPGQTPPGSTLSATNPPGSTPSGSTPPATTPPGSTPPATTPPGSTPSGSTPGAGARPAGTRSGGRHAAQRESEPEPRKDSVR